MLLSGAETRRFQHWYQLATPYLGQHLASELGALAQELDIRAAWSSRRTTRTISDHDLLESERSYIRADCFVDLTWAEWLFPMSPLEGHREHALDRDRSMTSCRVNGQEGHS